MVTLLDDFNTERDLKDHYKKHNNEFDPPFKSMKEYEQVATMLAKYKNIGKSDSHENIIGFMEKDGRKVVYRRDVGWLVVFADNKKDKDNPIVITFYPSTLREYINMRQNYYYKELPGNESR